MAKQLFFLSLADIFSVYPNIFRELISSRDKPSEVFLPSDAEWQEKVYYRLLEVQKRVNEAIDTGIDIEEVTRKKEKVAFDPLRVVQRYSPSPATTPNGIRPDRRRKCCWQSVKMNRKLNIRWSLEDICRAAKLLMNPPMPVDFHSELEMRKVYSLIYDVFRYKIVLTNALKEISFYEVFPEYSNDKNRVWLMLYELFNREFKTRKAEEIDLQEQLYRASHVQDISERLWEYRIRLAASISRMRIKYGALTLSQLLPIHLQNEKVAIAAANTVVSGWVNPFILRDKNSTDQRLVEMGFQVHAPDEERTLSTNQCKWDNICPLFISCIPENRDHFTKSDLMTKHYFIMQDRTFSYGPAVMSGLLDYFELDGDILQTHISSPRSTAYLAALFYSVNRLNNFYVYGAGSNLKEYRRYMDTLGVTNIRIFAESFTSFPLESKRFGTVVGIFANPPNSFSAISDPIDLICSRGGDLSMLEVLTESEISDDGRRRVSMILEEQLITLEMAMSRPQIQFILYQTHSIVDSENDDMVQHVIDLINRSSLAKHRAAYRERKRLEMLAELEAANIPSAAGNTSPRKRLNFEEKSKSPLDNAPAKNDGEASDKAFSEDSEENVQLPDTDEFVYEAVPDICINQDNCYRLQSTGCYLSLIKRKSIMQLNAKYLIKMAESRGLFGRVDKTKSSKPKVKQEVNLDHQAQNDLTDQSSNFRSSVNIENLMKRLAQPTNASFIRSNLDKLSRKHCPIFFNFKRRECCRYITPSAFEAVTVAQRTRNWWKYAFNCIRDAELDHHTQNELRVKFMISPRHKSRHYSARRRQPYPICVNEIQILWNAR